MAVSTFKFILSFIEYERKVFSTLGGWGWPGSPGSASGPRRTVIVSTHPHYEVRLLTKTDTQTLTHTQNTTNFFIFCLFMLFMVFLTVVAVASRLRFPILLCPITFPPFFPLCFPCMSALTFLNCTCSVSNNRNNNKTNY